MCTVLFIPQKDKMLFASLRDENPQRLRATPPVFQKVGQQYILSPKDALSGGTWAGVNNLGSLIILLNGGFKNHVRQEKYLISRGLIVNELLSTQNPVQLFERMSLTDIEPFTLVIWFKNALYELVWDGFQKFIKTMSLLKSHIWSSSTLYTPEIKAHRKLLFDDWIKAEKNLTPNDVLNFFETYTDSQNGFIMNRENKIKTLSFTFVELNTGSDAEMIYQDFESHKTYKTKMKFDSSENNKMEITNNIKIATN